MIVRTYKYVSVLPSVLEALKFKDFQWADPFDLSSRWSINALMWLLASPKITPTPTSSENSRVTWQFSPPFFPIMINHQTAKKLQIQSYNLFWDTSGPQTKIVGRDNRLWTTKLALVGVVCISSHINWIPWIMQCYIISCNTSSDKLIHWLTVTLLVIPVYLPSSSISRN